MISMIQVLKETKERERERESERQTDRQTDRQREREGKRERDVMTRYRKSRLHMDLNKMKIENDFSSTLTISI